MLEFLLQTRAEQVCKVRTEPTKNVPPEENIPPLLQNLYKKPSFLLVFHVHPSLFSLLVLGNFITFIFALH